MRRKHVLFSLVLSLSLVFFAGTASASGEPRPQRAPLSPAFLAYQESLEQETPLRGANSQEKPTGYIPSPVDFSHLRHADYSAADARRRAALPSSFDLRIENAVTRVRNQRPYGTCWAFSALGSMESVYLRRSGVALDLSPMHLAYYAYMDPIGFTLPGGQNDALQVGGNDLMAVAMLARWAGPVLESDAPYETIPPAPSSSSYTDRFHLQNAYFSTIGTDSSQQINDARKRLIMDYGAISIAYHAGTHSGLNESTGAWYNRGTPIADHGVLAVGWDDHYSREKFNEAMRPSGDGAWLIKNSWGEEFGLGGYFWLSYEDGSIADGVVYLPEETTNYDNCYDHDALGMVGAFGYDDNANTAWMANVFQARDHEILEAVSFYTTDANAAYEISVYTSLKNTANPTSGTRAIQPQTGSQVFAGYHTVRLEAPVPLPNGTSFSVVVKMTTPSYNRPIGIEYRVKDTSEEAVAGRGESFFSHNGMVWEDGGTNASDPQNACLKAFTTASSVPIPAPEPDPSDGSGGGGCAAAPGTLSLAALLPLLHRKKS